MARITRRQLIVLTTGAALYGGLRYGTARIARQSAPSKPLSDEANALISDAWKGLDPKRVLDTHVHVVGLGRGDSGCEVGPRLQSWLNPMEYMKFSIYLAASGVTDLDEADQQYVAKLTQRVRDQSPHGRALLFAFDRAHDENGNVLPDQSEFYTPNDYVLGLAKAAPDLFLPAASIHPYRADAVEKLEDAVTRGAIAVKWLPNAMNINPASPKCDAFYDALARLQVPLITHAGEEKAVHAEEAQRLGNPLHLRRPLEHGVTVIVAHCASLGSNPDLDHPNSPWVDNFELFMRLMDEPKWNGKLFGELSAMIQVNRVGKPLRTLLERPELHSRLVNGSDYPLPAINALVRTSALVEGGFITEDQRVLLNEIDQHNPLQFDFVTKRCLATAGKHFADEVFMPLPQVFPRAQ